VRVLGLVPARGGSRRLPRKNLATLNGRTLVRRSLETALEASCFAVVALSSEDPEVLAEGSGLAGVTLIERPAALGGDEVRTHDVVVHALESLDVDFDAVGVIQCTTPFTEPEDLRGAVELLEQTPGSSVVSVARVRSGVHPAKLKRLDGDRLLPFIEDDRMAPSHELPPVWVRNGAIYLARRETIAAGTLFADDQRGFEMPEERSLDIDTKIDLEFARFLLGRRLTP
jgi:CMP-N,N'-diacetyllegionaminic acid synthase